MHNWPVRPIVVTDVDDKHDAFAAAGAALTKSGTSTLELALAGVPMAVTYRVNPLRRLWRAGLSGCPMWLWSTCLQAGPLYPNCCRKTARQTCWRARCRHCLKTPPCSGPEGGLCHGPARVGRAGGEPAGRRRGICRAGLAGRTGAAVRGYPSGVGVAVGFVKLGGVNFRLGQFKQPGGGERAVKAASAPGVAGNANLVD